MKKAILITVAAASVLALAGCKCKIGGDSGSTDSSAAPAKSAATQSATMTTAKPAAMTASKPAAAGATTDTGAAK